MSQVARERLSLLACALMLNVSCGGASSAPSGGPRPALSAGPILPPSAMGTDFQWRQKVTAIYPTGRRSFEAVLQRHAGVVRLVGLSPMGRPGFVITLLADGRITVENHTGRELPFTADYILADVQRVFFPWLEVPRPGYSGRRHGEVHGLAVAERYAAGVLTERRFTRHDAPDRGTVTIRYSDWDQGVPKHVELENEWFGYRLVIQTLEQVRL